MWDNHEGQMSSRMIQVIAMFFWNLARYFDGPRKHFERGLVLVFDWDATDDHKFSALNQHKSIILQFPWIRSLGTA